MQSWNHGLDDAESVFRRYYDSCQPTSCYYDQQQKKDQAFYLGAFVVAFGGLATILMGAVNGGVNGLTSVVQVVSDKIFKNKIDFTKKDIYELHFAIVDAEKEKKRKLSGAHSAAM